MESDQVKVDVSDLEPGDKKFIAVEDIEIAILNVDGEYHAIRNSCAHMQGPVGKGPIEENNGTTIITCPLHNWSFDIETGVALFESKRLRTYDVGSLDTYDVTTNASNDEIIISL